MKLSQRLIVLAASLVYPKEAFRPGQLIVWKDIFIDGNPLDELMVVLPPALPTDHTYTTRGELDPRSSRSAVGYAPGGGPRIPVGVFSMLAVGHETHWVDPRYVRLATEADVKQADELMQLKAARYLSDTQDTRVGYR